MSIEIHMRNKVARFSFNGQTGVVVLARTQGVVSALTLTPWPGTTKRLPKLTVFWEAVMVQDKSNKESTEYTEWEERDIDPEDVEYLNAVVLTTPTPADTSRETAAERDHP